MVTGIEMVDMAGQPVTTIPDGPTTRRVEWRGLPSPFDDPAVVAMTRRGEITKKRREALWDMESKRQRQGFARFRGVTTKTITPERSAQMLALRGITGRQFSRTYRWGPTHFVVEMAIEDIELLMLMHPANAQAFRVLDEIITV